MYTSPKFNLQGSGAGLLELFLMGDLFFTADAYYELKNAGYYSPQLYEGYV